MGKSYGQDKVDDNIVHNHASVVDSFLFSDRNTFETTDGEKHTSLEEAREDQRRLDRR